MKARRTDLARHCCIIIVALALSGGLLTAPTALAQTITCDETTLSVNATDIKAEDLIKAIGNECGIKILLRGEVFTEDVFSVRFENLPIRTGIERVLRVVNIPNHMMHFQETAGRKRVIEIDLVGTKGGERQLTPSTPPPSAEERPSRPTRQARRKREKAPNGNEKNSPETIIMPPEILSDELPVEGNTPAGEVLDESDQEMPEEEPDGLEEPTEE